jgi:hypothetical protein
VLTLSAHAVVVPLHPERTKDFYPDDICDELDGRGWYESVHENGHYLILNLDKLQLTPTPEGWDDLTARNAVVGVRWVVPTVAEVMKTAGYTVAHTGGGCMHGNGAPKTAHAS